MNRDLVMGVSPYHDSSVAVIEMTSGKPLVVLSEDRHSGRSHHLGFPWFSVDKAVREFGVERFAGVGVPWDDSAYREPPQEYFTECELGLDHEASIRKSLQSVCDTIDNRISVDNFQGLSQVGTIVQKFPGAQDNRLRKALTYLLLKYTQLSQCKSHLNRLVPGAPILAFNHHECHAELSNFSPSNSSWVLTMDGRGEFDATVLWEKQGLELRRLQSILHPHSLGRFYELWSVYLGFDRVSGPGKLMGLASYGDNRFVDIFASALAPNPSDFGYFFDDRFLSLSQSEPMSVRQDMVDIVGPPRSSGESITDRHEAIAFGVQSALDRVVSRLVQHAISATGSAKGFLSGGVALNCVMNARLLSHVDSLELLPPCGDDGLSLGAANQLRKCLRGDAKEESATPRYINNLGTFNTPVETRKLLERLNLTSHEASPADLADALARNEVLAIVRGGYEFGPRALGNRSIFADPTTYENWPYINADVKFREDFRPFAPIMTEDFARKSWVPSEDGRESPFMLFAPRVNESAQQQLPAVVHVDGTSRIQTVNGSEDPWLYELLQQMSSRIGVPAVLNTSLNMAGESILVDIEDVLEFASMAAIDAVFVDGIIIRKRDNQKAFADIATRFKDRETYLARRPKRYDSWVEALSANPNHVNYSTAYRLIWASEPQPNLLDSVVFY